MDISSDGMRAHLVWDGGSGVIIPPDMGLPAPGQMEGAAGERLSELAGRICYDSLGKGRSSSEYHKHIKEVGHGSVYEHHHITVFIRNKAISGWDGSQPLLTLLNRPGIWVNLAPDGIRVTVNPRVLLDWEAFGHPVCVTRELLHYHASKEWPQIISPRPAQLLPAPLDDYSEVVDPADDNEKWVSLFMAGSRGFSHELVRHGDFTAISQRSTRFVDESESSWVDHPLICAYLAAHPDSEEASFVKRDVLAVKEGARAAYQRVSLVLQAWLTAKGVDKISARKQARGAARGYLGNALSTELIFSASVAQWKRMLRMRACAAADAEIRAVFIQALAELKQSRYGDCFSGFQVCPAADGIGQTAMETSCVKM